LSTNSLSILSKKFNHLVYPLYVLNLSKLIIICKFVLSTQVRSHQGTTFRWVFLAQYSQRSQGLG